MSNKSTEAKISTSSGTSTTTPLSEQYSYLIDAWNKASGVYDTSNANKYTGDVLASYTPEQLSNYKNMYDFANSSGAPAYSNQVASDASKTAKDLTQTGAGYNDTASGIYGMAGGLTQSGAQLTGTGAGAALGSARKLNNFTPTGGTDQNIANAGKYADNPYISGQVDATMRDARRQVSEEALPQIARQASLSGNVGSSKRGIAEGIVERGLAEKGADVSSQLRGAAYNKGIDTSESGRQSDNSSIIQSLLGGGQLGASVGNLGNSQTNSGVAGLNAGTNAGSLGLGYSNASSNASTLGLNANNQGLTQQTGLYGLADTAGTGLQASNQNELDAAKQKAEYGNSTDWSNLSKLYSIIGSNNWGGTTTSNGTQDTTATKTPSTLSTIGQWSNILGSWF